MSEVFLRLISAVVAVVFAVPVGGAALCADTPQKWLDRFTSANSTDTSADPTPEEAAAEFESGPFGIVFNEVRTYAPTVREKEPRENVKGTTGEEPVGEVSALEEPPVGKAGSEYTPVVGKALFSTSEAQSQEPASPGIHAAADETSTVKAASGAIQWPEGGFTGETTVTYNANGYTFPDGSTTNKVTTRYENYKEVVKYAHSDNVDDAGVQNGGYGNNKAYPRVVNIPGATHLQVDLTYHTEANNRDWVCAYAGSGVGDASCSTAGSLTGKLGGKTKETKSFTVDGDSVTFWFRSDGSADNFYGFYAVVSASFGSKLVSGEYLAPVDIKDNYEFRGWSDSVSNDGENLTRVEVFSPSDVTVYAQWGKLSWVKWGTVGYRITDDWVLKVRPWEGDVGETGPLYSWNPSPWGKYGLIEKIESTGTIVLNPDSAILFRGCRNLTDISGIRDWDTSRVESMSGLFSDCTNLTDLSPIKDWDMSNVTNISSMFDSCYNLTDITPLRGWVLSSVKYMGSLFNGCTRLSNLDGVQDWDTGSVVSMSSMFYDCSNLTDLDFLSNWDVSKVTGMGAMFARCTKLSNIYGLRNWNTGSLETTSSSHGSTSYGMFQMCSNLTDLTSLAKWDTGNVIDMVNMFASCSSLGGISSLSDWNVKNVQNMYSMFSGCNKLNDISVLSNWDVSNVTNMSAMFLNCNNLSSLYGLSNWNVSNVTNMSSMFSECSGLESLEGLSDWNVANVLYMNNMFYYCFRINNISFLKNWNVSNVTNMSSMFYMCSEITDISDLGLWNVSSVKYMSSMFRGCSKITGVSSPWLWKTGNVVSMDSMFEDCYEMVDISGLSNWDVRNTTSMMAMFADCHKISDFSPLSSWKTVSLKSVSSSNSSGGMFSNCWSLSDLTFLSGWDVRNVTSMNGLFSGCTGITNLRGLGNWDTSNVTSMSGSYGNTGMFEGCVNLEDTSAMKDWDISNVTSMSSIFVGCSNIQKVGIPSILKGGQQLAGNSRLANYLPTIILDDFTLGPYTWNQLKSEMQTNPDAFQEGTVWVKYTPSWIVSYNANGGVGSMSGAMTPVSQPLTLPEASYLRFGYKFTGWTTQPDPVSGINPLMKPGQIFNPSDKTDGRKYTLYAQWEKLSDTGDLPSSSQSGMLPGWVQVESGNTTGLIPPSSSITAWFKNKYAPGSTSLSLQFTKLLEGNAPDRVFQFDLYDVAANKVVQSVQNVGSTVKFNPLVFTEEGKYTYYVHESNTTDDKLIYDDSLREVTVAVTASKDDPAKLTATAQILGDVTFNNKYKTASLKISKTVEGTEAKDKDFSFMVNVTKSDGSKLEGAYPTQVGDSASSVTFKDGVAALQLKAGEEVTITGLPANSKYTVDETSLPKGYSIKNLSNPDGMLSPADTIEVTAENRYTTTPGIAQLRALKRYVNAAGQDLPQKNGMFEFAVCEVVSETECNGIGEAQSNGRGEVVFPVISYDNPGNHAYRISEIIGSGASIAYDRALVTAEVAVTDNGEGELVTTIVYKDKDGNKLPEGELPVFVNRDASASIIPVTGSLAVWSFVVVFGAAALWLGVRAMRVIHGGRRGAAHARR